MKPLLWYESPQAIQTCRENKQRKQVRSHIEPGLILFQYLFPQCKHEFRPNQSRIIPQSVHVCVNNTIMSYFISSAILCNIPTLKYDTGNQKHHYTHRRQTGNPDKEQSHKLLSQAAERESFLP